MDKPCSVQPVTRAVVAGGSISGLLAGSVLARYFDEVLIVERDEQPAGSCPRRGVPQAAHPHVLLAQGRIWLEGLLPGIGAELLGAGALRVRWPEDVRWHASGGRCAPRIETGVYSYSSSRGLIEQQIRQRVMQIPNVTLRFGAQAQGLTLDSDGRKVIGLRTRRLHADADSDELVSADLVVDAMGRASRASEWLGALGKAPPPVSIVQPYAGYASCLVSLPQHRWPDAALLLVREPSGAGRAGGLYRIEGDRFIATVVGVERDYPPTDFAGMLAFARTLPSRALHDVLQHAEPLGEVANFRRTENRLVHYEQGTAPIEGFIVLGDAACAFNPVYSQGMAIAALAAVTLRKCLSAQPAGAAPRVGFTRSFQRALARANKVSWQLSSSADVEHARASAKTEHARASGHAARLPWSLTVRHRLLARVLASALERPRVTRAFVEVMNLVRSPWCLLHPRLIVEWLRPRKRAPRALSLHAPLSRAPDAAD